MSEQDQDADAAITETVGGAAREDDLAARLTDLDHKVDTIAGAMAAVARSQNDLLAKAAESDEHRGQDVVDLAHRLDSLERLVLGLTKTLEGADARTDDRFAALRDAATVPVNDLKDLLVARTERTESRISALLDRIESSSPGAAAPVDAGDAPPEDTAVAEQLDAIGAQLDVLATRVDGIDLSGPLATTTEDLGERLADHTDNALAGLLRLIDERLEAVRRAVDEATTTSPPGGANAGGFEAGAVMGAAQAAWNRLEQRLDHEFDELGRQLQSMSHLIEQALATAEAAAARPVVNAESFRKTASSLKEAIQTANRNRRERRFGGGPPPSLGSGP